MSRLVVVALLIGLIGSISPARAADEDLTRKKLDAAKEIYNSEIDKFAKLVNAWFDSREEAARKNGDKHAVEQLKVERQAFADKGDLPATAPPTVAGLRVSARTRLDLAYEAAVKTYTRQRQDDLATTVQKEWDAFKSTDPGPDGRRRWVHSKGEFKLIGTGTWVERNSAGNTFQYKENARTKEYVELDAVTGDLNTRVRLYDTRADYGNKQRPGFRAAFQGKW